MSYTLVSPYLQFVLNPGAATWSLFGSRGDDPYLEDVSQHIRYRRKRRRFRALERWQNVRVEKMEASSPHGKLAQLNVEIGSDQNGLRCTLRFALPQAHPLLLWQVEIDNQGDAPVEIEHIEMLAAGFFPKERFLPQEGPVALNFASPPPGRGVIRPHADPGELAFFSNGWQSWSHTGVYGADQRYRNTRLGPLGAPMWYNPGTPRPKKRGYFGSDMFGILGDRLHRTGILAGFLSQKQHFGSLEAWIGEPLYPALRLWANGDRARLDPGASISTDWACIQFVDIDDPDPLAPYLEAVAREHVLASAPRSLKPPAGWCSWYHFYQDIDEDKIAANLNSAAAMQDGAGKDGPAVPLDLFQIDDGFQAQIGDWFQFSTGFPNGVAPLAAQIEAKGFTPGLWLAPFIVHARSKLARQHRDWLLRNRWGLPVNAGFVWNNFTKALDLTHPKALAYACDIVHTAAHRWGFPYLKLDFLYAAALAGRYRDRTKTRAQVLRDGLEALRRAVGPDVTLLGCGVPLGSSIGIFDAMRIGADVAPRWLPEWNQRDFFLPREPSMPSTRNALQNTLTRAPLHRRWWINDPDCLLVRPDSDLTLAEVQSLATAIALTGGSLLLSDDLPALPPERLRIVAQLLPLIDARARVVDWFDEPMPTLLRLDLENETGRWHLLAIFNWEDEPTEQQTLPLKQFDLPPGAYFARSFWTGESRRTQGGSLTLKPIPAHGVRLLALTPDPGAGEPLYLGGDLHISQGLEVAQWSVTNGEVDFLLQRPGSAQGQIELFLASPPSQILLENESVSWDQLSPGIYRLDVAFSRRAHIEVKTRS